MGCLICTEISLRAAYLAMRTLLRGVGMDDKLFGMHDTLSDAVPRSNAPQRSQSSLLALSSSDTIRLCGAIDRTHYHGYSAR